MFNRNVGLFVILVINVLSGRSERLDSCEKCLHKDRCTSFGYMNVQEQEEWIETNSCEGPTSKNGMPVFGFASPVEGYICCPDTDENAFGPSQNHKNNRPVTHLNTDHVPDSSLESNKLPNRGRNHPRLNGKIKSPQNLYFLKKPEVNTPLPYNRGNDNGGSGNGFSGSRLAGQSQCTRLTGFPPEPESGCCGRDKSDVDRIIGSQIDIANRRTYPSVATQQPWEAQNNFPFQTNFWQPSWRNSFLPFGQRTKRADKVNITLDNRISGGKATEIDQYPWTVLLKTTFYNATGEASFNCGGSIISSRYILTAAHCLVEEGTRIKNVEVILAEYDKRTFPTDCAHILGVGERCVQNILMNAQTVITHPRYDDKRLQNDIAMLRLPENAPFTDYIRPICLPPFDIDQPEFYNLRLTIAGWGRNGPYSSDVKQFTDVSLVTQEECSRHYPFLTRRHLCAAGYSGEDTCKGDSGGPLMMVYEGKYFVAGVVSGKRADSPCGTSVPSLYTNVFHYLDWIKGNIRQ